MRNAVVLFALCVAVAGCGVTERTGVRQSIVAPAWSWGAELRQSPAGNREVTATAEVDGDALRVEMRLPHAPAGWTYQVFVDSDHSLATGYLIRDIGAEYVVRGPGIDPEGLVVRTTDEVDSNPGGWGPITGRFESRIAGSRARAVVPMSALGSPDAGRMILMVVMFTPDGGFAIVPDVGVNDGSAGISGHHGREPDEQGRTNHWKVAS